jgi:hypothetical protein
VKIDCNNRKALHARGGGIADEAVIARDDSIPILTCGD